MRPFFLRIVRKGKSNNTHKDTRINKADKEDKPRTTKAKPQKIGKEREREKNRDKERKRKANKGINRIIQILSI